MQSFDFVNTTAIVTGGTRGIGKSIVELLLDSGCTVLYTGTKKTHDFKHTKARYEQLDCSKDKSIKRFVAIIQTMPSIHILVNNAGINIIEPIDSIDYAHWAEVLQVNLTVPMLLMREVAGIMKKNGKGGKILNMSSMFGMISKEKRDAYSASKSGLIGLTRAAALDLAPDNILVNALCPGVTLTELTREILSEKGIAEMQTQIPLGRCAEPKEIAKAAVFLCSHANTFMTGQTIVIDGGFTIQ